MNKIRMLIVACVVATGLLAGAGTAFANQPPPGIPGACSSGAYAGCSGDGLNGGAGTGTGVQAFWGYLYRLQHLDGWEGLVIFEPFAEGVTNPVPPVIVYGGSPLQAFLYALHAGPAYEFDIVSITNPDA